MQIKRVATLGLGFLSAAIISCGGGGVELSKHGTKVYVLQKPQVQFRCGEQGGTLRKIAVDDQSLKIGVPITHREKKELLKTLKYYISLAKPAVLLTNNPNEGVYLTLNVQKIDIKTENSTDRVRKILNFVGSVSLHRKGELCKEGTPVVERVVYQKPIWDKAPLPSDLEMTLRAEKLLLEETLSKLIPSKRLVYRELKTDNDVAKSVALTVEKGYYERAIKKGLKFLKKKENRKNHALLYNVGVAYEAAAWNAQTHGELLSKLEKAKEYYSKALELKPNDRMANRALKDVSGELELLKK